jgi:hypothetical protein
MTYWSRLLEAYETEPLEDALGQQKRREDERLDVSNYRIKEELEYLSRGDI